MSLKHQKTGHNEQKTVGGGAKKKSIQIIIVIQTTDS